MTAWFESPAARRLGVRFPIVQGRSGAYRPRSSWQRSRTSADSARTEPAATLGAFTLHAR